MFQITRVLVLICSFSLLLFSTFISFYEGSQILTNPLVWEHTAVFSHWIKGDVTVSSDILTIDYLLYAAKHSPFFPLLMLLSTSAIFFQLVFWLFKNNPKVKITFCTMVILFSIIILIVLKDSPTTGLHLISMFFGILIIFSMIMTFWTVKNYKKDEYFISEV
ncbi:DUF4306 domain-containing protein [Psychrobacillus sp. INOP01]|uniref:DUF4306 domain-containing protein n=1 Tax=Psychrobacillus sp. INOP01 TaxID=2829187 RepID=UPI001BA7CF5E|nr:DUF4306 domain-containing protein [Psychrobacillus sp. INOP01]QUG39938.1 DUF4306 domain-containing protein [Psychrobacillus sp. INOP01]